MAERISQKRQRAIPPELFSLRDRFVMVTGPIESVAVETNVNPRKIDHVWLEVRAGTRGILQITLNTSSWKSAQAGFDPRVRLGIVISSWSALPAAGARLAEPFDYATFERAQPIDYQPYERSALEQLLVEKAKTACFAQGWGEFFVRSRVGIHQIHDRRASFADLVAHKDEDGALALYFEEEHRCETLLFKFAGQ